MAMTKVTVPAIAAALTLSLAAAPAAFASGASTLSQSGLSGMSCAAFTHLPAAKREALVRQANLASGPILFPRGGFFRHDTGAAKGTPLQAGLIIQACQAVPSSTSVGDAYNRSFTVLRAR